MLFIFLVDGILKSVFWFYDLCVDVFLVMFLVINFLFELFILYEWLIFFCIIGLVYEVF